MAVVLLALAACASPPPAPSASAPPVVPPTAAAPSRVDGVDAFERQQRDRAETAQRQGRLAEAAVAWEALTALKPQRVDYRERLAAVRVQIQAHTDDRLGKAAAAQKRGDLDGAAQHYLAALALDPLNEPAADALRAIERERQKRHAGRLARDPLQRRSNGEMDPRLPVPASPSRAPAKSGASGPDKSPKPPAAVAGR